MKKIINKIEYDVKRGSLKAINQFKKFVGEDKFEKIMNSSSPSDIPLDETRYEELLSIILTQPNNNLISIPYDHTEELLGFFCEPFAGRSLKQVKSILNGLSSMLQKLGPEGTKILTGSTQFPKPNGSGSDVVN